MVLKRKHRWLQRYYTTHRFGDAIWERCINVGEIIPILMKDFKNIGIEIQNTDGSPRDIYSIQEDFLVAYKDLDDLTKHLLVEKIVGKRQAMYLIKTIGGISH